MEPNQSYHILLLLDSACAMETDAVDNLSSCQMSGTNSTFVPELFESTGKYPHWFMPQF